MQLESNRALYWGIISYGIGAFTSTMPYRANFSKDMFFWKILFFEKQEFQRIRIHWYQLCINVEGCSNFCCLKLCYSKFISRPKRVSGNTFAICYTITKHSKPSEKYLIRTFLGLRCQKYTAWVLLQHFYV